MSGQNMRAVEACQAAYHGALVWLLLQLLQLGMQLLRLGLTLLPLGLVCMGCLPCTQQSVSQLHCFAHDAHLRCSPAHMCYACPTDSSTSLAPFGHCCPSVLLPSICMRSLLCTHALPYAQLQPQSHCYAGAACSLLLPSVTWDVCAAHRSGCSAA